MGGRPGLTLVGTPASISKQNSISLPIQQKKDPALEGESAGLDE